MYEKKLEIKMFSIFQPYLLLKYKSILLHEILEQLNSIYIHEESFQ